MYIITSHHLKMKFIVQVEERHRSSPSAITSYIEIRTCIEHYATRAIYGAELRLVSAKCLDKNKRQITRNFSFLHYAILYFNANYNVRNKTPSVVCAKEIEVKRNKWKFTSGYRIKISVQE